MVLAWALRDLYGERSAYVLRSYHHPQSKPLDPMERNPGPVVHYPIARVARATSAAPFYFQAMKLNAEDPGLELIDGGFGANNPSEEAYREVKQMSELSSSMDPLLLWLLVDNVCLR